MRVVWCFWAALLVVACDAPPVRIGFVAGLTGPYAELGVDGRDAVLLAVAEVAAKGGIHGRPVEVVVRDAGTDEVDCAAALEEVASQGVVAILGPMVSRHARVTLAAMERHPEILFFSPTMSTELLSGRDDMLVRSIAKAADQGGCWRAISTPRGPPRSSWCRTRTTPSTPTTWRRPFGTPLGRWGFPARR